MNAVQVLGSILTSVAAIVANPALGLSVSVTKFLPLLSYITSLVALGDKAITQLKEVDTQVKAIVASGAPPTDADWEGWNVRHAAAKARLQA